MTAAGLRASSPAVELAFLLVVAAVVGVGIRRRGATSRGDLPLSRPVEVGCLAAILVAALLWRTLFAAAAATPRWFFPQSTTVLIADALARGGLAARWLSLLRNTQVAWVHESPVMLPVAAAFQVLLGPSLHLPTLIGALWGLLAAVLAWALGRAVRSPIFGLLFAALVAATPLQITWSRLGGLQIGAVAHVLLVAWLAYGAGARAGVTRTLLTLLAVWASVYHYYAARVAIPLAAVAWTAGLAAGRPPGRRLWRVLAVVVLAGVATGVLLHRAGFDATLWPRYGGYVGNQGERTVAEYARSARDSLLREAPLAARAYLWCGRARRTWGTSRAAGDSALVPGMADGGLALLPFAVLGIVGLGVVLRHPRRDALWLALAVLGAALPLLSRTSARRLLILDLGWCALGACALTAFLGSRWCARLSPRALASGTVAGLIAVGTWSFLIIRALGDGMPPAFPSVIPFGESGFMDGVSCPECLRRARVWQDDIAQGAAVVLVDTDVDRENRTSPGGLALSGEIVALAEGRPEAFLQYYALVSNVDVEPPRFGAAVYDPAETRFATMLRRALEQARPVDVVWHFAAPTQWERWLAARLEAAGGRHRAVGEAPAYKRRGPEIDTAFEVVVPWDRRDAMLGIFEEIESREHAAPRCIHVEPVTMTRTPKPVLTLAARDTSDQGVPHWTFAGFYEVRDRDVEAPVAGAVGLAPADQSHWSVLTRSGGELLADAATGKTPESKSRLSGPIGRDCAVALADRWWAVDALTGKLSASVQPSWPLPEGHWIGVGRLGDALVLASADQFLLLVDPITGRERRRIPAVVPPSRRLETGECTPIVAGPGWVATFDHLTGVLLVYDAHGQARGAVRLADVVPALDRIAAALATHGEYLGVGSGFDQRIFTLRMTVAPECPG